MQYAVALVARLGHRREGAELSKNAPAQFSWQQNRVRTKLALAVGASQHQAEAGARSSRRRHWAARERQPRLRPWWLRWLCPWAAHAGLRLLAGERTCQTSVPSAAAVSVSEIKAVSRPLPRMVLPSSLPGFCRLPRWLSNEMEKE